MTASAIPVISALPAPYCGAADPLAYVAVCVEKSDKPSKTVSKIKRLLGNDIWNQVMVLNACDRNAH